MKTRWTIAALAAALPLAAFAIPGARDSDKNPPAMPAGQSVTFEALDANKDGRISMPEASADPALVEGFSSADKDGDGYLDNAEYERVAKKAKR